MIWIASIGPGLARPGNISFSIRTACVTTCFNWAGTRSSRKSAWRELVDERGILLQLGRDSLVPEIKDKRDCPLQARSLQLGRDSLVPEIRRAIEPGFSPRWLLQLGRDSLVPE